MLPKNRQSGYIWDKGNDMLPVNWTTLWGAYHIYTKPELLATAPRQLWSWDITKLKGAQPWTYYYLYVILDVFSR